MDYITKSNGARVWTGYWIESRKQGQCDGVCGKEGWREFDVIRPCTSKGLYADEDGNTFCSSHHPILLKIRREMLEHKSNWRAAEKGKVISSGTMLEHCQKMSRKSREAAKAAEITLKEARDKLRKQNKKG